MDKASRAIVLRHAGMKLCRNRDSFELYLTSSVNDGSVREDIKEDYILNKYSDFTILMSGASLLGFRSGISVATGQSSESNATTCRSSQAGHTNSLHTEKIMLAVLGDIRFNLLDKCRSVRGTYTKSCLY